ncbi:MAG: potassium/proton antiporter [Tannerellaceae bacterium]|nr:potassium/proton antiporter [Tannerellaceae bacterium]
MFQNSEGVFLFGSLVLIACLLGSKLAGSRLGTPMLLLFLLIGMLCGEAGFIGIPFDNPDRARSIGILALIVTLFSGGMDTKLSDIKPIYKQGISMATIGVFITAGLTGFVSYYIFKMMNHNSALSMAEALLLAAVMSSTDSASVFSILQGKKVHLKNGLGKTLELESGSNDPMAYLLTIMIISFIQAGNLSAGAAILTFVLEIAVGGAIGFGLGWFSVKSINKWAKFSNEAFYPIAFLAGAIFIFAVSHELHGNGYLAVYIAGLVIGNSTVVHKRYTRRFFDGVTWLFQIVMFLTLGLLVNPGELWPLFGISLVIGVFMICIARPVAVFFSLLPFMKPFSKKGCIYLSWVGLKGAVPIIFAIYPITAGIEHAQIIFNVVFIITILSLFVQGSTVVWTAQRMNLIEKAPRKDEFGVELPDEIKSAMSQIDITAEILTHGNNLMTLKLPDHTLAVMVMRDKEFFIPKGETELKENDKLLVISDNDSALLQAYETLGINDYTMTKNEDDAIGNGVSFPIRFRRKGAQHSEDTKNIN